jgi:hypothetical protein
VNSVIGVDPDQAGVEGGGGSSLWQTVYGPEPAEEPLQVTVKSMGIEAGIKARRPERLREPLCDLPSTCAATAGCRSHHYGCGRAARTADRLAWPVAGFVPRFTTSLPSLVSLGFRVGG